ncbi:helix-turn-helix transcriptional regulator [Stenotrophomonas maltophilia]|nr:helix-turn-helix transcriptional regulator [Stenotrophomonas maltophilia]ELN2592904.1 helix-turn-helix transcriptional regulator [Stenotrophomonas maltophilia]MBH1400399.1 helix-turn-helix transcriptional regulator [Stenotrophomonas maltophilia]MBH1703073.1 helix-turn-helix transcriptional regulator [Stenotrophomonas maltophilia]
MNLLTLSPIGFERTTTDLNVITARVLKNFSAEAEAPHTLVGAWKSLAGTVAAPGVRIHRFPAVEPSPEADFVDIDAKAEAASARATAAGRLPRVLQRVGAMLYGDDLPSLKALRLKSGLSQEQFAEKMKTSQATVSKWERGLIDPRRSTMSKIADVLGVSVGLVAEVWCRSCKAEGSGNA